MPLIFKIIFLVTFLVIFFYTVSFLDRIIFGESKETNKLSLVYQQSNRIMRHIKNTHRLPNPSCIKIECLASWKKLEEEIAVLEKRNRKLVKFLNFITGWPKKKRK